ncbi:hypothetical protein [Pseudomonas sp. DWP3-1-2]|uniref:hypothetical protein n=1 Tax=Pseudomonas sp. DWP3-1-2 TaxID=2804645 RepID=UPI003CF1AD20
MNTTSENSTGNVEHKNAPPEAHLQHLQEDAKAALESAKEHGTAQFEQYRDTAAEQIKTLAQGAESAAQQMQGSDTLGLSHYVTDIAQNMTALADNLRGKSVDELLQQAGKLARDNPVLFLTGSVAVGFGISRFLRASSSESTSTMASSQPSGPMGDRYKTEISSAIAADEELPVTPPHTDDVFHGSRPGIPDRSASPNATGAFIPTDPLGSSATYPDSQHDSSLSDIDRPQDDAPKTVPSRGGV